MSATGLKYFLICGGAAALVCYAPILGSAVILLLILKRFST